MNRCNRLQTIASACTLTTAALNEQQLFCSSDTFGFRSKTQMSMKVKKGGDGKENSVVFCKSVSN